MLEIKEKENFILKEAMAAKRAGRKLFIFGTALAGKWVYGALCEKGIMPDGFCVSTEYYAEHYKEGGLYCGLPVASVNRLGGVNNDPCSVIIACGRKINSTITGNMKFIHWDFRSLSESAKIDFSFINEHKDSLEELYEELGDEKSRQCMAGYLNQMVSGKFEYLESLWTQNQYYEKEVVNLKDVSCIIDCGAYDGDTFYSFCENYKRDTGKKYMGQAFLLEPNENTYRKLRERFSEESGVVIMNLGAWNEKAVLSFSEDTSEPGRSEILDSGENSIEVDKLDDVVPQTTKVDFIKMDIEGSELNALKGAENIIKKYHPILAVCVYHKTEDLVTIPQFIKSLYSGYRLYLRVYTKCCGELVLYALPC